MTLEHIAEFFTQVNSFEAEHRSQRITLEQSAFLNFKNKYLQKKPHFNALRKSEAPYFNLFELLNIRHLEETLHTPMLHHLLDPYGIHEQGALYLNAFFSNVVLDIEIHFDLLRNFVITEEYNTSNGRIDIILRYNYQGRNKLIIIENKIYARDQEDQLQRYYLYAYDKLASDEDLLLIYLTPFGKTPTSLSMNLDLQHQLRLDGILKEISYRHNIIPWLETAIEKTSSEKVKQTIIQYLMTLHEL